MEGLVCDRVEQSMVCHQCRPLFALLSLPKRRARRLRSPVRTLVAGVASRTERLPRKRGPEIAGGAGVMKADSDASSCNELAHFESSATFGGTVEPLYLLFPPVSPPCFTQDEPSVRTPPHKKTANAAQPYPGHRFVCVFPCSPANTHRPRAPETSIRGAEAAERRAGPVPAGLQAAQLSTPTP